MPTPVDIANRALISIGSAPVQNFDDATNAATTVKLLYDDTILWLLGFYPWSFTKQTIELSQTVPQPTADVDGRIAAGWTYCYDLPSDALGEPIAVYQFPRVPLRAYKQYAIENQLLYTDWKRIFATLQYAVDPNRWSPTFLKAAVAVLAAEFVVPISGNSGMLQAIQEKAWGPPQQNYRGGFLGAAIKADARSQPSPLITQYDPLTQARWG
jgi:hypothetical protein